MSEPLETPVKSPKNPKRPYATLEVFLDGGITIAFDQRSYKKGESLVETFADFIEWFLTSDDTSIWSYTNKNKTIITAMRKSKICGYQMEVSSDA